eukprot:scaffold131_cov52-Phaeocystis_antarctica.AAC.3
MRVRQCWCWRPRCPLMRSTRSSCATIMREHARPTAPVQRGGSDAPDAPRSPGKDPKPNGPKQAVDLPSPLDLARCRGHWHRLLLSRHDHAGRHACQTGTKGSTKGGGA